MRRLLVLGVVLAGCVPAWVDNRVAVEAPTAPYTHAYSTTATGVFVAASSRAIVAFTGPGCALRSTLAGGPDSALVCEAPGRYQLQTTGVVNAGVVVR
jgi:hypothetical protein